MKPTSSVLVWKIPWAEEPGMLQFKTEGLSREGEKPLNTLSSQVLLKVKGWEQNRGILHSLIQKHLWLNIDYVV